MKSIIIFVLIQLFLGNAGADSINLCLVFGADASFYSSFSLVDQNALMLQLNNWFAQLFAAVTITPLNKVTITSVNVVDIGQLPCPNRPQVGLQAVVGIRIQYCGLLCLGFVTTIKTIIATSLSVTLPINLLSGSSINTQFAYQCTIACDGSTCFDGVKNQDETDIDCGGRKCPKCADTKTCNVSSDCINDNCGSNICQTCSLTAFINGGFEFGNSTGWTLGGGRRLSISTFDIKPKDYMFGGSAYDSTVAETHSMIVSNGTDPIIGNLMAPIVFSGSNSFRMEDLDINGYLSVLSQQITNYLCLDIYFAWLAVLENGGHSQEQSSFVLIELKDLTYNDTLLFYRYNAGADGTGIDNRFQVYNSNTSPSTTYFYTPFWQIEHLSINASRIGHTFELTVLVADCSAGGHRGYAYIDSFGGINPTQTQ